MARHYGDVHVSTLLGKWDGRWFVDVARNGYDTTLTHRTTAASSTRTSSSSPRTRTRSRRWRRRGSASSGRGSCSRGSPGSPRRGGSSPSARSSYDRRVGVALAVLWGVLPHAIVESMVYSEALFTALAAWSLYALLRRQWLAAGALCLLAGATRAAAGVLVAVVMVAAVDRARAQARRRAAGGRARAGAARPHRLPRVGRARARPLGRLVLHAGQGLAPRLRRRPRDVAHVRPPRAARADEARAVRGVGGTRRVGRAARAARVPAAAVAAARVRRRPRRAHARRRGLLPLEVALPAAGVPAPAAGRRRRWGGRGLRTSGLVLSVLALASAWYGGYLLLQWPASP